MKVPESAVRELYEVRRLPIRDVASRLGVAHGTLYNALRTYGIGRRIDEGFRPGPDPYRDVEANEEELLNAWAAGLFDGEGCITLVRRPPNPATQHRSERWEVRATLGLTVAEPVHWLKERYGGHVHLRLEQRTNRKDSTHWQADSRVGVAFVGAVYPFLRIKRPQADVALAYQKIIRKVGRRGYTDEALAEQRTLVERIKELNRRGLDNPSV